MIRNNIRRLRRAQKLSQHQLADILGVQQTLISAWELGKSSPTEENTAALAEYFDVSSAYVLGKTQNRFNAELDIDLTDNPPEQFAAKDFKECELLEIYRMLPENGKMHLLFTAHILEKYFK